MLETKQQQKKELRLTLPVSYSISHLLTHYVKLNNEIKNVVLLHESLTQLL